MNEGTDESSTDPQFTSIQMDPGANSASVSTHRNGVGGGGAPRNASTPQVEMERFLEMVDETQDILDKIRDVVQRVKQVHDVLLSLPAATSDLERERLSNELDDFMADVKRNASRVRQKVARMSQMMFAHILSLSYMWYGTDVQERTRGNRAYARVYPTRKLNGAHSTYIHFPLNDLGNFL